jgi:hypothetical protein
MDASNSAVRVHGRHRGALSAHRNVDHVHNPKRALIGKVGRITGISPMSVHRPDPHVPDEDQLVARSAPPIRLWQKCGRTASHDRRESTTSSTFAQVSLTVPTTTNVGR